MGVLDYEKGTKKKGFWILRRGMNTWSAASEWPNLGIWFLARDQ